MVFSALDFGRKRKVRTKTHKYILTIKKILLKVNYYMTLEDEAKLR